MSYWLKAYGILNEKRQQKMEILTLVKHCAIPELPSPDTTALFHLYGYTYHWADGIKCMKHKPVGSGPVANVKRLDVVTGKLWKERLHFFEDVSILLWHNITTTTHLTCIKLYRWLNMLLNVWEIMKILHKRWKSTKSGYKLCKKIHKTEE